MTINLNDSTDIEQGFDTYQHLASQTAIYPDGVCPTCGVDTGITYTLLGLIGEVGEFANKYKKVIRDGTEFTDEDKTAEVGDIQWYVSELARQIKTSLGYIASKNLEKLFSRKDRGVLGGSGDNR